MKKIKVMHFVSGLVSGGVEEMIYNYCKFMNQDKYEFVVVYQHEPVMTCKDKIESVGCKTIRITARSENFLQNIKDSIDVIAKESPDIVHAHMNLMNFCALWAAYKLKIKVRISHSHIAEKNKNLIFNVLAFVCKKLCSLFATTLFACGEEAGEYLYGKRLMASGQVKIVENAIDLQYFKLDEYKRKHFRSTHNIDEKLVVGHVGRFSLQKNHKRLLQIFKKIVEYHEDSVLLLVGTGELEDEIKSLASELNIIQYIIFFGTTKDMNAIYSSMDVFVLPSLFEGLPVVSIELQAADVPAVFSDTIAPSCKLTETIRFMSLKQTDEEWAKTILDLYHSRKKNDLRKLFEKYDIRSKAKKLETYYDDILGR